MQVLKRKGDGLSAVKDCVLLYTNINTITTKMHELQAKIIETKAKIVAMVKIHAKNCHYLEIHPKNCRYQLSAKDYLPKN